MVLKTLFLFLNTERRMLKKESCTRSFQSVLRPTLHLNKNPESWWDLMTGHIWSVPADMKMVPVKVFGEMGCGNSLTNVLLVITTQRWQSSGTNSDPVVPIGMRRRRRRPRSLYACVKRVRFNSLILHVACRCHDAEIDCPPEGDFRSNHPVLTH